ncbi:NAD-dependent epimerase/dehydratase family protein [Aerosakkonema funiforme]
MSPVESITEDDRIAVSETATSSMSPVELVEESDRLAIEETPELSNPEISGEEANITELENNSESNAAHISGEEANRGEIDESTKSNSSQSLLEERKRPEIKDSLESKSPEEIYTSTNLGSRETAPSPRTPQPSSSANKRKRIFITGASGCIGQYLVEKLIRETEHELYLLVRDPGKLRFDCNARPGINIVRGDIRQIPRHANLLKTIDCAVLIATSWGGTDQEVLDVNIYKNIQLLNLLDRQVCQQIIYFSTASILDRNNQLLKEARELGTSYIRSKHDFLRQASRLPIYDRITAVFPTLVLGGDAQHPYSHISSGLPGITKWIKLIRFFKADASFHFIHSQDIAEVVGYLIENPPQKKEYRQFVLGNPAVTVNQVVEEACAYLNQPILFRLPLSVWLANLFIVIFKIQMSPWDRFCLEYRHFTYQNAVNPATFGLPVYCATFSDVLKSSGVVGGSGQRLTRVNNYRLDLDDRESESGNES